jgi:hypothetical protein
MIRTGSPLALLFFVACAEAPPAPIVAVSPSPPIASSPPPAQEVVAPPPPSDAPRDPPTIALPVDVACALTTTGWRGTTSSTEIRVADGGPIFATVVSGAARLHLPIGSTARGAVLEVADNLLAVRGHVAGVDVWLHPAKAFVMGGAVVPLGDANLVWSAAKAGVVVATFEPREGITLTPPSLTQDVPCDALSLDSTTIEATTVVPGSTSEKWGLMRLSPAVPLSLVAGGPPLATLAASSPFDSKVTVMETAGKSARIFWERENSAIFGWVPTSALTFPSKLPIGHGSGSGSGSGLGGSTHPAYRVICPDDVTAIVDIGGERWTVGRILAGSKINVMSTKGDYRPVLMRGTGIQIADGAQLIVQAARIAGCKEI